MSIHPFPTTYPVPHRADIQPSTLPFTPMCNYFEWPINLTPRFACFWTVGGSWRIKREPTQTQRQRTRTFPGMQFYDVGRLSSDSVQLGHLVVKVAHALTLSPFLRIWYPHCVMFALVWVLINSCFVNSLAWLSCHIVWHISWQKSLGFSWIFIMYSMHLPFFFNPIRYLWFITSNVRKLTFNIL